MNAHLNKQSAPASIPVVECHLSPAPEFAEDTYQRADGIDALAILVARFTVNGVHAWLQRIAALQGQDLPCTCRRQGRVE